MITHQKNYSLYRLYNSNATNPPNICAKLYDTISFVGRPPPVDYIRRRRQCHAQLVPS